MRLALLSFALMPTNANECPANVEGAAVQMDAPQSTGGNGDVFERTGQYIITNTQKHDVLALGGGSEAPVGQTYVCTKRYHSGWGE